MSLVGKYVAIKYDIGAMLEDVYEVIADKVDTIEVKLGASNKSYWKHSILAVFDNKDQAQDLIKMNKTYLEWKAETSQKDKRMRQAITSFATDFNGGLQ